MVSHCSSLETYSSLLNEVVCNLNMIVASIYTVIRSYLLEAMSGNDANNICTLCCFQINAFFAAMVDHSKKKILVKLIL